MLQYSNSQEKCIVDGRLDQQQRLPHNSVKSKILTNKSKQLRENFFSVKVIIITGYPNCSKWTSIIWYTITMLKRNLFETAYWPKQKG